MSPKSKAKKGSKAAKIVTLKTRVRRPAHRSQPLPTYSPTSGEDMSELNGIFSYPLEAETSLNQVMDMLVDISSRL